MRKTNLLLSLLLSLGIIFTTVIITCLIYKNTTLANNPTTTTAKSIKIAVAGPLTGNFASFGQQFQKGAQQAIDDLNQAGGIKDQKLELITADDICESKQAVIVANRLAVIEGVDAIIGHFCSSATLPASDIYAKANILMITPASTTPTITSRNLSNVLRICGSDEQQGETAALFIVNHLKARNIAIIHDTDIYGQGIAEAMRKSLHQLGSNEALFETLKKDEQDFTTIVTKIQDANADAVYFGGSFLEAGLLVKQLRKAGILVPFISGDGITSDGFVKSVGNPEFLTNVYMTFGADPRKISASQKIVTEFRKNNYEPKGYTLYAYAAVQIIAEAIKNTNSTDGKVLSNYLKSHTVNTVMGQKSWDSKGDLTKTDFVIYQWHNNGTYTQL